MASIGKEVFKTLLQGLDYSSDRWSIQGLGMLRYDFTREARIHIWDSRYRVPGVSAIHTHPWDLTSYVIAGKIRNNRFNFLGQSVPTPWLVSTNNVALFNRVSVSCNAEKQGEISAPEAVYLLRGSDEIYTEGASYSQTADEIHESTPEDGTVTFVKKRYNPDQPDVAHVFYPVNERFGDAIRVRPTAERVAEIINASMRRWF